MKCFKSIMYTMALLAAFSCNKAQVGVSGQVSFDLNSRYDLVEVTKSSVSDYTTLPSKGDFTISILDASSASVYSGKLSAWDTATQLPSGNYSVSASYGSLEDEGFDKPFFSGVANFAITGGNIATVSIPVSLGNTVVKVNCTDSFKNYFKDYTFKLVRGTATLATFAKDETKAAFVDGYKLTIQGTLTSETGTQTFEKEYTNLKEATAYTFEFDAPNVGGAKITVSFNNTVETIELGDIEIND